MNCGWGRCKAGAIRALIELHRKMSVNLPTLRRTGCAAGKRPVGADQSFILCLEDACLFF